MALLATSCTMRNKPSRLLDKGPEYLRTRTNGQIFEHRRKSAVELLAASKPQYVKSAAVLDSPAGLTAGTPDRHFRSICQPRERPAPRSKSEFDIAKLHELLTEDEADSNCVPRERSGRKGSAEWRPLSAEGEKSVAARSSPDSATAAAAPPPPPPPPRGDAVIGAGGINRAPDRQDESQRFFLSAGTANTAAAAASTPAGPPPPASSPPPPLTAATATPQPSAAHSSAAPAIYTARPIYINLSHSPEAQAGSTTAVRTTPGSSCSSTPVARGITVLSGGRHLPSPSGHLHHHHQQQHHHHHHPYHHLSSPPESPQPPLLLTPAAMSEESSDKTPTNPTGGEMGPPPPSSSTTTTTTSSPSSPSPSPSLPQAEPQGDTERSWGVVVVVTSSPSAAVAAAGAGVVVPAAATTTTTSTSTTSASSSSSPGPGPGPRVSMRTSGEYVTTFSGLGSGGGVPQVPRSFSDIACHHSRAGSDVSSEASRASRTSRASRASAGANLEKFFNEMGMERDILDPLLQLQLQQQQQQQQQQLRQGRGYVGGSEQDLYESLSSLDSHDARSICSALSRSEKEISADAESFERSQHQTSIVERNARIIKWLCSVKKAKTPAAGLHQGSAAS